MSFFNKCESKFYFLTLAVFVFTSFFLISGINYDVTKSYAVGSSYTISFNANGGTGSMNNQIFTDGVSQNLYSNNGSITREGYSFVGWSTSSTGEADYSDGQSYNATSNVTLYAVWSINEYNISFEVNGGTEIDEISQDYNSSVTLPTPTRAGYTFNGWYLDEELTQVAEISLMGDENVTLYASWTKVESNATLFIILGIALLVVLVMVPTAYYLVKKSKIKTNQK